MHGFRCNYDNIVKKEEVMNVTQLEYDMLLLAKNNGYELIERDNIGLLLFNENTKKDLNNWCTITRNFDIKNMVIIDTRMFTKIIKNNCFYNVSELLSKVKVQNKYKVTQYEYDTLEYLMEKNDFCKKTPLSANIITKFLKEEYESFKNIDENVEIKEIFENCEITEEETPW